MLHLIQLYNMVDNKDDFIALFDNIQCEVDELGYEGMESELVKDLMFNHFGLEILCTKQLQHITNAIMNKQGNLGVLKLLP